MGLLFFLLYSVLIVPCSSFFVVPVVNKQPVALYKSSVCVGHDPGRQGFVGTRRPDQPARLEILLEDLETKWVPNLGKEWLQVRDPEGADVTDEQLLRVHTRKHLNTVNAAFASAKLLLGAPVPLMNCGQTFANSKSEAAAKRAAGLVIAAVDDVFGSGGEKKLSRAFVMARPPGHHAEADQPMGFCFYNNVLLGVAHAKAVHGLGRIAILDFDVHHGNGDADIVEKDPSLLYISSHEADIYPGTGESSGRQGRHKNIINACLPSQAGSSEFRSAWSNELLPAIRAFRPEAIFLSAGFDAHRDEYVANMMLTEEDYKWLTEQVVMLGKPIISVLEGGYNLRALPKCVRAHLEGLIG